MLAMHMLQEFPPGRNLPIDGRVIVIMIMKPVECPG